MNTPYTKGPWVAEKHPMGHHGIFQRDHAHQVAEVLDRNTPPEMVEANASLIAAAPEMLEALDMLAGLLPVLCASFGVEEDFGLEVKVKSTGETRQMLFSEVISMALATMAKASGQNSVLTHPPATKESDEL